MTEPLTFESLTRLIEATAPNDLAPLAGAFAAALSRVIARIAAEPAASNAAPQSEPETGLLTVGEAAQRLGVSPTWLYRNAKDLPFTRKLGHRTLRFDPRGLERWAKAPATAA